MYPILLVSQDMSRILQTIFIYFQQTVINSYFMISEAFCNHTTPSTDEKEVQQY